MAKALRPIGHEDRLSIVDHLDELRSRMMVCGAVLLFAFFICFWQNHALLHVLNRALPHSNTVAAVEPGQPAASRNPHERGPALVHKASAHLAQPTPSADGCRPRRADARGAARRSASAAQALPSSVPDQVKPITIGIGEPFTTTLTVAFYFALLFSLPVLIYQGYAFVIPALNPSEKRVALPIMAAAPVLFAAGVAFTYLVVLPPAVHFLQGFNSGDFDILVQAKAYYTFEILTMLGIGLAFQLPLGLLGLDAIGAINAKTLTRNWRYCIVIIAVIAAALPGADPVTTALETLPLVILYLASIVLLKVADRRRQARRRPSRSTTSTSLARLLRTLMLFDLRGRGRRRTVQVIYLGLAIILGGGLVLFGVGTGSGNGGLLNAFGGSGGGGGSKRRSSSQQEAGARSGQGQPERRGRLVGAHAGPLHVGQPGQRLQLDHEHVHDRGQGRARQADAGLASAT